MSARLCGAGSVFLRSCSRFARIKGVAASPLSFIVSNKVSKHAVVRNTIKRRLREIIRKRTDAFRQDADYAFIAKAPSATASFDALKGDVESILARLPRPSGAPAYRRSNSPVSKKPLLITVPFGSCTHTGIVVFIPPVLSTAANHLKTAPFHCGGEVRAPRDAITHGTEAASTYRPIHPNLMLKPMILAAFSPFIAKILIVFLIRFLFFHDSRGLRIRPTIIHFIN